MAELYLYATTIAVGPLKQEQFSCRAVTILGGGAAESYVSRDAYYIWMRGTDWDIEFERMTVGELRSVAWQDYFSKVEDNLVSAVYRIPFDGQPIGLVKLKGLPINQFSFREDGNKLHLVSRVPVESNGYFSPDYEEGQSYYTSIDLNEFKVGVSEHHSSRYIHLSYNEECFK